MDDQSKPPAAATSPISKGRRRIRGLTEWFNDLSALVKAVTGFIAVLGALAVGLGLYDAAKSAQPNPPPPEKPCAVRGQVRDRDNKKPVAAVDVGSVPRGTGFDEPQRFRALASTDKTGKFSFDCADVRGKDRVFALLDDAWGGCLALTKIPVPLRPGSQSRTLYFSGAKMRDIAFRHGDPQNPCAG